MDWGQHRLIQCCVCVCGVGGSSARQTLSQMGGDLGESLYKYSKCITSKTVSQHSVCMMSYDVIRCHMMSFDVRYQLKVMASLAEEIMAKLATPTDHTPSPNITLPDVVTSTTSHTSHSSQNSHRHSSHSHKKHAQNTLHRFRKLDIHQLQLESRYMYHRVPHTLTPSPVTPSRTAQVALIVIMKISSSERIRRYNIIIPV